MRKALNFVAFETLIFVHNEQWSLPYTNWQRIIQSGVMYCKSKVVWDRDRWKDLYSSHKFRWDVAWIVVYICCDDFSCFFFKFCASESNDAWAEKCSFEYWRPPHNGDISCCKYITIFWSLKMALTYSHWNFLFSVSCAFIYRIVKIDSCRSCISVKLPKSMDSNAFSRSNSDFMNGMKCIFHLSIWIELHIFFLKLESTEKSCQCTHTHNF